VRLGLGLGLGIISGTGAAPDVTGPTLVSAVIDAAGTTLTLTYDEALDETSEPALGDVDIDGPVLAALTGTPNVTGSTVVFSIAPAVIQGEAVTFDYVPGTNKIKDLAGNEAASLTAQAVDNDSSHLYDPRDEGDAVLWVDMQDAASFTEVGGLITSINNKITSTAIPAVGIGAPYEATGLNGHPCMHPTGTTHGLSSTEAAVVALGVNAPAYTMAWYGSYDTADPAARQCYLSFGRADNGNGSRFWGHNATGGGRQIFGTINDAASAITTASGADNSLDVGHTVIWRSPGTTHDCKVNDAAPDPDNAANDPVTSTPVKFTINCRNGSVPAEGMVGECGEWWLFSTEKSDAACTRIEDYLAAKWAAA
jgi:hypothetical protein